MLSRTAESIFWMERYIERAISVAGLIDVNLHVALDLPAGVTEDWSPILRTVGGDGSPDSTGAEGRQAVVRHLAFDRENPNSVLSSLTSARENARSVREVITGEMWEQVNRLYLIVQRAAPNPPRDAALHEFLIEVRTSGLLYGGIVESTLARSEAWHFGRLGRHLERADMTSRIIDAMFESLGPGALEATNNSDGTSVEWSALLKSTSALEMYRQSYGVITTVGVLSFLMLNSEFPRAVRYCVDAMQDTLDALEGRSGSALRQARASTSDLALVLNDLSVESIVPHGLQAQLLDVETRLNDIGAAIGSAFFYASSGAAAEQAVVAASSE